MAAVIQASQYPRPRPVAGAVRKMQAMRLRKATESAVRLARSAGFTACKPIADDTFALVPGQLLHHYQNIRLRYCRTQLQMPSIHEQLSKLTWLVLDGDPAARSHRVEQFTAL